jgi:hypothetical protein
MSKKGGYIILDLNGITFVSGEAETVGGAYEVVANPYGKATLISGLKVGSVVYPDFFAPFIEGADSFAAAVVIGGNTIDIAVDDEDNVTVTVPGV